MASVLAATLVAARPVTQPATTSPQAGLERLSAQVVEGHRRAGRLSVVPELVASTLKAVRPLFPDTPLEVITLALAEPDATALPGGQILINEGLLLQIHHTDELKFILAHEAAHIAQRHVARHVITNSGVAREALEIEADRIALQALADTPPTEVRNLMKRLRQLDRGPPPERWRQLEQQLPQPDSSPQGIPDSNPDSGSNTEPAFGSGIKAMHERAIEVLINSGHTKTVAAYLQQWGSHWPPEQLQFWRWAVDQRRGVLTGETPGRVIEWARSIAPAIPANPTLRECSQAGPITADSPVFRWNSLVVPRLKGWQRSLQTGTRLVLSPDHPALHRIDLWRPGYAPDNTPGQHLPCPLDAAALWHLMVDMARGFPDRKWQLESVRVLGDGLLAELNHTDESGVQWRVLAVRRQLAGEPVYGMYRAPAIHFFQPQRSAAVKILANLSRPRQGGG